MRAMRRGKEILGEASRRKGVVPFAGRCQPEGEEGVGIMERGMPRRRTVES
jgi:hypothetical protein